MSNERQREVRNTIELLKGLQDALRSNGVCSILMSQMHSQLAEMMSAVRGPENREQLEKEMQDK